MTLSVRDSPREPGARGWHGAGRGRTLVLRLALAAAVGLVAARPGAAQSTGTLPEMDTHWFDGLRVDAPSPLREHPEGRAALDRAVARSSAIGEAHLYLWNQGDLAVSVAHYGLVTGADYDLHAGLEGALDRGTRQLGARPQSGPDAYSIRATEVSGRRALVGSNRVPVSDGGAVLRAQVTRAGRDVWVVMVFGREGPRLGSFSDAVLGSLAIEGS